MRKAEICSSTVSQVLAQGPQESGQPRLQHLDPHVPAEMWRRQKNPSGWNSQLYVLLRQDAVERRWPECQLKKVPSPKRPGPIAALNMCPSQGQGTESFHRGSLLTVVPKLFPSSQSNYYNTLSMQGLLGLGATGLWRDKSSALRNVNSTLIWFSTQPMVFWVYQALFFFLFSGNTGELYFLKSIFWQCPNDEVERKIS